MAPKKKAQKMALADFFADSTSGSWADEMDNLPTAPAAKDPNAGPARGEPGYLDAMPDRASRPSFNGPPREELPLPTVPPFTAFVGNMSFETDEEALKSFFGNSTTVRIMKDPQGAPKGFGYVEFGSQDGLKEALGKNGTQLAGRTVRVTVAEAPSSRREFTPSAADEASQWRRSGPLPARDPPPAARRQGSYNDAPAGGDRDWSSARGARFTPSVPSTPSGLRRDSSGPGREREFREREPSMADDAGQWRSSRPLVDIKEGQQQHGRGGFASGQTSPSLAETEQTWSRGTKLRTPATSEPPASGAASPAEERDWRSSRATSAVPSNDGENSPRQPPAPVERRKLNLAPRSASTDTSNTADSPATPSSSIFGSAKPADTASKEREAAAKLAARDAERKKAREEEFAKEAEKGKKLAEEKARSIREAQEKAQAELSGKKPQSSSYNSHPREKEKKRPERKIGEDGFEVARGKTNASAAAAAVKPQAVRKESTTRTGFSFANAARSGYAAETTGEEDEAVAEVTNGVEDVKV